MSDTSEVLAAEVTTQPAAPPVAAAPVPAPPDNRPARSLALLHGVEMSVTVELGRARLLMRDLLALRAGSIVELDRAAGSPVDVMVNGTLLARGEVVVVDDELGVRITEIVGTADGAEL
ncbi:MAG TPA: flagellar motor switch protein FliN [Acidimicrobiales bacterium]|nr:flagellar motor switch protein FliN [Acidimicrobiales bacterium]